MEAALGEGGVEQHRTLFLLFVVRLRACLRPAAGRCLRPRRFLWAFSAPPPHAPARATVPVPSCLSLRVYSHQNGHTEIPSVTELAGFSLCVYMRFICVCMYPGAWPFTGPRCLATEGELLQVYMYS